jgi:hypothetical protein
MSRRSTHKYWLVTALLSVVALVHPAPAQAAVTVITQGKANAGNVTPGDAPGFPITLSQPGSYRLATNLTVPANKDGISITSHDVTIDLEGFRIHGFSVANNGIVGTLNTATIRNGLVALFKFNGIHLGGHYHLVENMRIVGNGSGIVTAGDSTLIRGNVVSSNGAGIVARNSLIEGNVITGNSGVGVRAGRSTVLGNNITSNGGYGIFGEQIADGRPNATGYGNNTLANNNGNGAQVFLVGPGPMHPNACASFSSAPC